MLPCSEAPQQRLRLDLSSPVRRCQTHIHVSYLPFLRPAVSTMLSTDLLSAPEWLSCLCPRTEQPGLSHVLLGVQRQRLPAGPCGAAFRAGSSRELSRYVSRAEWSSWTVVQTGRGRVSCNGAVPLTLELCSATSWFLHHCETSWRTKILLPLHSWAQLLCQPPKLLLSASLSTSKGGALTPDLQP